MGRLEISGPQARLLLQELVTAEIETLPPGKARYSLLCREDGGILDDLVVYSLEAERLLVVCNAASRIKVYQRLSAWAQNSPRAKIEDLTLETAMIALQGPRATQGMEVLYPGLASHLSYFGCVTMRFPFGTVIISRSGYTGEDGFELIIPAHEAPAIWEAILQAGAMPCGLGARDTLRLEAALLLYGNDMDESVNPVEAGLGRFVAFDKPKFFGKEVLARARDEGTKRKLVGLALVERGIPRSGASILWEDKPIGWVTSGGYSPTLDRGIGLGYVPQEHAAVDSLLDIDIRGKLHPARVVKLPFYRRGAASQAPKL